MSRSVRFSGEEENVIEEEGGVVYEDQGGEDYYGGGGDDYYDEGGGEYYGGGDDYYEDGGGNEGVYDEFQDGGYKEGEYQEEGQQGYQEEGQEGQEDYQEEEVEKQGGAEGEDEFYQDEEEQQQEEEPQQQNKKQQKQKQKPKIGLGRAGQQQQQEEEVVIEEEDPKEHQPKKRGLQCPNCGSTDIDQIDLSMVCLKCGVVVDDSTIAADVEFMEGAGGTAMMMGQFVSATSSRANSNLVGGDGARYFSTNSRELTMRKAKRVIKEVSNFLRLHDSYVNTALRYYEMAVNRNFTLGRKRKHVVATCLYIACRQEKSQHMLIDFSDALQVNVYTLGTCFLKFRRLFCLKVDVIDPALYVSRFAEHLDLDSKARAVALTALRLVGRMNRDWIITGRRPAGICAAALLIAARAHGFSKENQDVTRILKVCGLTVSKRVKEFELTSSASLTLEQFSAVEEEREKQLTLLQNQNDLNGDNGEDSKNNGASNPFLLSYDPQNEADPPVFTRNRIREARARAIQEKNVALLTSGALDHPMSGRMGASWRNVSKPLSNKEIEFQHFYQKLQEEFARDKSKDPPEEEGKEEGKDDNKEESKEDGGKEESKEEGKEKAVEEEKGKDKEGKEEERKEEGKEGKEDKEEGKEQGKEQGKDDDKEEVREKDQGKAVSNQTEKEQDKDQRELQEEQRDSEQSAEQETAPEDGQEKETEKAEETKKKTLDEIYQELRHITRETITGTQQETQQDKQPELPQVTQETVPETQETLPATQETVIEIQETLPATQETVIEIEETLPEKHDTLTESQETDKEAGREGPAEIVQVTQDTQPETDEIQQVSQLGSQESRHQETQQADEQKGKQQEQKESPSDVAVQEPIDVDQEEQKESHSDVAVQEPIDVDQETNNDEPEANRKRRSTKRNTRKSKRRKRNNPGTEENSDIIVIIDNNNNIKSISNLEEEGEEGEDRIVERPALRSRPTTRAISVKPREEDVWKKAYPTTKYGKALILPEHATEEERQPSTMPIEAKINLDEWKSSIPDYITKEIDDMFLDDEEIARKEAIFNKINKDFIEQQQEREKEKKAEKTAAADQEQDDEEQAEGYARYRSRNKRNIFDNGDGNRTTRQALLDEVSRRKISRKINYDAMVSIFDDGGDFSTGEGGSRDDDNAASEEFFL